MWKDIFVKYEKHAYREGRMITYKKGDVLEVECDLVRVIPHVCNDAGGGGDQGLWCLFQINGRNLKMLIGH